MPLGQRSIGTLPCRTADTQPKQDNEPKQLQPTNWNRKDMKIYFSRNTAGRYGGALNGNLRFLPNVIQTTLDNSCFTSTFDELWLTLSYPPLYVLPGVVGMEKQFFEFYNKFPYSRLNRKFKKIEITLKAPEFSEHFDLKDQERYSNRFDLERQYKNLSEVDLGRVLIDKYLEAGEIINSKIKKEDKFDFGLFKGALSSLRSKISPDFLETVNKEQTINERDEVLDMAIKFREERKQTNKVKDKKVRDLRIYYNGLPNKALYPYDYQYTEIFRNLLRGSGLMCPTYHHLYIQVAKTFEDGLRDSFSVEDWYVYGIAVVNYEEYLKKTESEKDIVVIDTISNGLFDIANIDSLETSIIKKIVEKVKVKGLDTELIFNQIENANHVLTITYLSRSMEEQCPIFFHVLDKKTKHSNKIEIGRADNSQIYFWLQNVTVTKDKIKVKSSSSIEAGVYLGDKPRTMEFNISEILNAAHATPT